ncbi:hypothetical protein BH23ACT11_BH23ACT11_09410 [soil metagenome]
MRVEDPVRFLTELPGRKLATVPDRLNAIPMASFAFRQDDTIVFGSESGGISSEVLDLCATRITIPQRGATESLNLAMAVGIVVYEFLREADA